MTPPEQNTPVNAQLKSFTVSVLPENHRDFLLYVITVERTQGTELWKIRHGQRVLDDTGTWTHDGPCRCRNPHRPTQHTLSDARQLAAAAAPAVAFNGRTASDTYRAHQESA